jgi:hypothetical protein
MLRAAGEEISNLARDRVQRTQLATVLPRKDRSTAANTGPNGETPEIPAHRNFLRGLIAEDVRM